MLQSMSHPLEVKVIRSNVIIEKKKLQKNWLGIEYMSVIFDLDIS